MPKILFAAAASAVIAASAFAAILSGTGPTSASPTFAQVSDRKIAYQVHGAGGPTIVLITGLGDGMDVFDGAAVKLSRSATVITYDRPGYGNSSAADRPADARAAAEDLAGVLQQSGVPGPYIIVGHSLGGLIAEQFAALHPEKISGLVLEDSRPATFGPQCEAAGVQACTPTSQMVRWASAGTQRDVSGLESMSAEVAAIRPASNLRVLVISRALATSPTAFEAVWSQAQMQLAHKYPGALQRIAPTSRHDTHRAAPDWFCATIIDFATRTWK